MTITILDRIVSFDIEIATILESAEQLNTIDHLDLSCAVFVEDGVNPRLGLFTPYSLDAGGGNTMDFQVAGLFLQNLMRYIESGFKVCAWNGASFDLRWLGHAAGNMELAGRIAVQIYDPMLQFFMMRGFPVSLAAVAEAMGVPIKKSMDGADAPKAWAEGRYDEVLEYCEGDCRITNAIVSRIVERRCIQWVTKRGKVSEQSVPALLPVREVIALPMPDQSWMDEPIPLEKFISWIPEEIRCGC